jgi:hypothetical protein
LNLHPPPPTTNLFHATWFDFKILTISARYALQNFTWTRTLNVFFILKVEILLKNFNDSSLSHFRHVWHFKTSVKHAPSITNLTQNPHNLEKKRFQPTTLTATKFGLMYSRKRISQTSFPNLISTFPKSLMIFCQELLDPKRNYENQIWTLAPIDVLKKILWIWTQALCIFSRKFVTGLLKLDN